MNLYSIAMSSGRPIAIRPIGQLVVALRLAIRVVLYLRTTAFKLFRKHCRSWLIAFQNNKNQVNAKRSRQSRNQFIRLQSSAWQIRNGFRTADSNCEFPIRKLLIGHLDLAGRAWFWLAFWENFEEDQTFYRSGSIETTESFDRHKLPDELPKLPSASTSRPSVEASELQQS